MNVRTIAGLALVYVAVYGLPDVQIPTIPTPSAPTTPTVETPSMEMQQAVAGVAEICERMDTFDRLVWMATWEDAAAIVGGDSEEVSVEFENTLGLRLWQENCFEVAWSRIAKASGKYKGLGEAVEQAFVDVIGTEVRPMDAELVDDVLDLYHALAWAGARGE